MRQALVLGFFAIGLCACESFPQLDAVITEEAKNADYPELLPSSQLKELESEKRLSGPEAEILAERAERLHRRANALRNLNMTDS